MEAKNSQLSIDIRYFPQQADTKEILDKVEKFIDTHFGATAVIGSDVHEIDCGERTITQLCSECDTEVEVPINKVGKCPECGNLIKPCLMCSQCVDNCPFDEIGGSHELS